MIALLLALVAIVFNIVVLMYVIKACTAAIECEKHLRVIAWEMQKAAKQNQEPPQL